MVKKTGLPEVIKIGYQHVKIAPKAFNEEESGRYNDHDAEIFYHPERSERETVNTIIHESLHAICHNYGLRNCVFKEADREELVVNTIANGLTQVFLDNPELLDWIKENLHA